MPVTIVLFAWQHKLFCIAASFGVNGCFPKEKGRQRGGLS
jgi:hypothetical protein